MQEQIFEQREEARKSDLIPVEEFIPKWTALKERIGDRKPTVFEQMQVDISYGNSSRCLVGESHGFDSDYSTLNHLGEGGCDHCTKMSFGGNVVAGSAYNAMKGTVRDFYAFKESLYNHFFESHPEKLVRN